MRVLALAGKARHGKNTVAEVITSCLLELGYTYDVMGVAFADAVRAEAHELGWDGQKDERGRTLLQQIGQGRRDRDPDYWVNKLHRNITSLPVPDKFLWVVTDCRYRNEAEAVHAWGGKVWRVRRLSPATYEDFDNGLTPAQKAHPSEVDLDGWAHYDHTVVAVDLGRQREQVAIGIYKLQQEGWL